MLTGAGALLWVESCRSATELKAVLDACQNRLMAVRHEQQYPAETNGRQKPRTMRRHARRKEGVA